MAGRGKRNPLKSAAMLLTYRPATRDDVHYLLELEETCMRGYAEAIWHVWRPSAVPETLNVSGHEIIGRDGETVGCIAVTWHRSFLFIDKLYIDPRFQGQGIGAIALAAKVEAAAQQGLPTKLSVLTSNPALRFYRREGFVIESETPERRLMVKALSPGAAQA
jgi:ribosomal protein S18 acetylase RimI-like enzyme